MSKPVFEDILNYKTGRRNRKSYTLAFLSMVTACVLFTALSFKLSQSATVVTALFLLLSIPLTIVLVVGQIAITAQRLRDTGYSGWLMLLLFIPFVSLAVQLLLFFMPGQKGENKYGPDPRGS